MTLSRISIDDVRKKKRVAQIWAILTICGFCSGPVALGGLTFSFLRPEISLMALLSSGKINGPAMSHPPLPEHLTEDVELHLTSPTNAGGSELFLSSAPENVI